MNTGRTVLSQLMAFLHTKKFQRHGERRKGNKHTNFSVAGINFMHGLPPTPLRGELAGYRMLPLVNAKHALPYGYSRKGFSERIATKIHLG